MNKKRKHAIKFTQPSRTRQSEKDGCNINLIMAKYEKTGLIENTRDNPGQYGDFSNVSTYQDALNQIMLAQNQFDMLPADLRKYFNNQPKEFLEFCDDPNTHDQQIRMGLRTPPEPLTDSKPKMDTTLPKTKDNAVTEPTEPPDA